MLAEIIKITIPDWACCIGWGVLFVTCFIGCLYLYYRFVVVPYKSLDNELHKQIAALGPKSNDKYGVENELRKQIATLVSNSNDKYGPKINAENYKPILGQGEKADPKPSVFRPSNPRQLLSYEEVVAAYNGGIDNCLCTGAYSVLLNPKIDICSVCNDKGTIQGRRCSCQVVKYWKDKC